ncbi:hypothetical protein B0H12DRAFT_1219381 [Mycena haematopus]|nr:hypothetical protein B0H12DRAFT_1219381 [Mycena haematopus]
MLPRTAFPSAAATDVLFLILSIKAGIRVSPPGVTNRCPLYRLSVLGSAEMSKQWAIGNYNTMSFLHSSDDFRTTSLIAMRLPSAWILRDLAFLLRIDSNKESVSRLSNQSTEIGQHETGRRPWTDLIPEERFLAFKLIVANLGTLILALDDMNYWDYWECLTLK